MRELHDSAKKTLKDDVEDAAEQKNQEDNIDLTLHEIGRVFKGAFRSFAIPGASTKDIDSYFDKENHTLRH